ncbi:apolipoprotein A-I-binding protein-like, partial [Planoprotostelium fungivorum]
MLLRCRNLTLRRPQLIPFRYKHDMTIKYLGQKEAQKIDEELMGPYGFAIEQLMELAGLSVANAVTK